MLKYGRHRGGTCGFSACRNVATLFMFSPKRLKHWYCVTHYDRMAEYYKKSASGFDQGMETWAQKMMELNGF